MISNVQKDVHGLFTYSSPYIRNLVIQVFRYLSIRYPGANQPQISRDHYISKLYSWGRGGDRCVMSNFDTLMIARLRYRVLQDYCLYVLCPNE